MVLVCILHLQVTSSSFKPGIVVDSFTTLVALQQQWRSRARELHDQCDKEAMPRVLSAQDALALAAHRALLSLEEATGLLKECTAAKQVG